MCTAGSAARAAERYNRCCNASAAATRSAAHRAPGRRPIRSTGPETDTAATTVPVGVADRRRHAGHARLALGDALRPAAAAHLGQRALGELASGSSARWVAGSAQAASTCAAEPAVIGSRRADRHGVAQPAGPLGRGDADALVAVAAGRAARSRR